MKQSLSSSAIVTNLLVVGGALVLIGCFVMARSYFPTYSFTLFVVMFAGMVMYIVALTEFAAWRCRQPGPPAQLLRDLREIQDANSAGGSIENEYGPAQSPEHPVIVRNHLGLAFVMVFLLAVGGYAYRVESITHAKATAARLQFDRLPPRGVTPRRDAPQQLSPLSEEVPAPAEFPHAVQRTFAAMGSSEWIERCMEADLDQKMLGLKVLKYRIRWRNGSWSQWWVPGEGDDYDKDGPRRRWWACFATHEHEMIYRRSGDAPAGR